MAGKFIRRAGSWCVRPPCGAARLRARGSH